MIDFFCIFTTGGLLLWAKHFFDVKIEQYINNLIKSILLEEKRTQEFLNINGTILRWKVINEQGLIFAVGYNQSFNLLYTDYLLDLVAKDFTVNQLPSITKKGKVYLENPKYNERFLEILKRWEKYCSEKTSSGQENMISYSNGKEKFSDGELRKAKSESNGTSAETGKSEPIDVSNPKDFTVDSFNNGTSNVNQNQENVFKGKTRMTKAEPKSSRSAKEPPKSKGKEKRTWTNEYGEVNNSTLNKYDQSKSKEDDIDYSRRATNLIGEAEPDNLNDLSFEISEEEAEEKPTKGLFGKLTSSIQNIVGNKVLTKDDLDPIMKTFIDILVEKNVAKDIAENLCSSVQKSLLKTKTESFTTIKATIKSALKETISKILTPKQDFDILKQALKAKNRGEPFKIVFIGVNGVGKSTNLAKVCYLLMNNGLKILIAACDNFRSGAVEQLKTHSRALGVDLFEQGYKNDPAYIAREAIDEAKKSGYDCVLIDTAGRMQDNEPLMKNLAKLVEVNNPDAILFVGEALTGNDSVDQLVKFNQALIDNSKKENPRTIDGIVLTKFDTVDDKVGAALTMVYTTGKPIVYVGTGQKYTNLKKLNVNHVLNALFG